MSPSDGGSRALKAARIVEDSDNDENEDDDIDHKSAKKANINDGKDAANIVIIDASSSLAHDMSPLTFNDDMRARVQRLIYIEEVKLKASQAKASNSRSVVTAQQWQPKAVDESELINLVGFACYNRITNVMLINADFHC
jgi:hypothetical protein